MVESTDTIIAEKECDIEQDPPSLISQLTPRQKAAALLIAMGSKTAGRILQYFSKEDLLMLDGISKTLPNLEPNDLEELVCEIENSFADGKSISDAGNSFNKLLVETFGEEKLKELFQAPTQKMIANNVWEATQQLSADKLLAYFEDEHPQIFAYVFSRLPEELAAKILLQAPAKVRSDIIQRTMNIGQITNEAQILIEETLKAKLSKNITIGEQVNYNQIATILNHLEKEEIDDVIKDLSSLNENDLNNIKSRIFTFEDIIKLKKEDITLIFDAIEPSCIINTLSNADNELKECILSAVSQRLRRMIEAELQLETNIPAQEISESKQEITKRIFDLAKQHLITLPTL